MNINSIQRYNAYNTCCYERKVNKKNSSEPDTTMKYTPVFKGNFVGLKGLFSDIEKFVGQFKSFSSAFFPKNKIDSTLEKNENEDESENDNEDEKVVDTQ